MRQYLNGCSRNTWLRYAWSVPSLSKMKWWQKKWCRVFSENSEKKNGSSDVSFKAYLYRVVYNDSLKRTWNRKIKSAYQTYSAHRMKKTTDHSHSKLMLANRNSASGSFERTTRNNNAAPFSRWAVLRSFIKEIAARPVFQKNSGKPDGQSIKTDAVEVVGFLPAPFSITQFLNNTTWANIWTIWLTVSPKQLLGETTQQEEAAIRLGWLHNRLPKNTHRSGSFGEESKKLEQQSAKWMNRKPDAFSAQGGTTGTGKQITINVEPSSGLRYYCSLPDHGLHTLFVTPNQKMLTSRLRTDRIDHRYLPDATVVTLNKNSLSAIFLPSVERNYEEWN